MSQAIDFFLELEVKISFVLESKAWSSWTLVLIADHYSARNPKFSLHFRFDYSSRL